ncbi:hypothetical protein GCM10008018_31180 [Paenibacillus marchantiophytorum]|uniref:Uncharacterized protein n=1 Tax=Paenibacillus marchantiophytorum TaxID=1619310 RepID=A0ABQ1EQT9_9BACL|nr:hypothetical protein [Paenibacillus marchantiophytorum]GFZ82997.1 hypothetical protein GCM10008018_31180 [Paenibacillus marchantiophytorum]
MDTLSLNEKRKPFKFVSKIFPIPHLRSVICGTGNLDLILEWVFRVQRNVIAADISFLNSITTKSLLDLNKKYSVDLTSTIYQFGYSEVEGVLKGAAFRSTSMFQIEEYSYCSAIKPKVQYDLYEEIQKNGLDEAFISLMSRQKEEDDINPERIGVGGEIHRFIMNKDTHHLDIIFRFPDYGQCYNEMLDNLN